MYVYTYTCTHTQMHTYSCMYTHMYSYIYTHTHTGYYKKGESISELTDRQREDILLDRIKENQRTMLTRSLGVGDWWVDDFSRDKR